ncbi:MAG: TAXI family TRAP transporter solute-binding subunit [Thermodesulfobacteriota bacterium]
MSRFTLLKSDALLPVKIAPMVIQPDHRPSRALERLSAIAVCVSATVLMLTCLCGHSEAGKKDRVKITLLIASGVPESMAYHAGMRLASLWTTQLRDLGIRVSAAASEGSLENLEALRISDADVIIVEGLPAELSYHGKGPFKKQPLSKLRAITALWEESIHVVAASERVSTGTVKDLGGLVVATGLPGSTRKLVTDILLKQVPNSKAGLRAMSDLAAVEALRRGTVQGLVLFGVVPTRTVSSLFDEPQPALALLEIDPADIAALKQAGWKDVGQQTIPAGAYRGQDKLVKTAGQRNLLAVSAGVEPAVVYALTKTLFENLPYFAKLHPACTDLGLDNAMDGVTVPLHPGALRYFTEKRVEIPGDLIAKPPDSEHASGKKK